MNHHLRFDVRATTLVATTALGLLTTSCSRPEQASSPPPKIEIALKANEVRYHCYFFETSEDKPTEHLTLKGILNPEVGKELIQQFRKKKTYREIHSENFVSKTGQTATFEKTRKFTYPIEHNPPIFNPKPKGIFPVTPSTPKKFTSTQLGITGEFQTKSSDSGYLDVSLKLQRRALLGFVNHGTPITAKADDALGRTVDVVLTENRIEIPVISLLKMNSSLTLQNGHFLLYEGSFKPKVTKTKFSKTSDLTNGPTDTGNFIALIQVERGR